MLNCASRACCGGSTASTGATLLINSPRNIDIDAILFEASRHGLKRGLRLDSNAHYFPFDTTPAAVLYPSPQVRAMRIASLVRDHKMGGHEGAAVIHTNDYYQAYRSSLGPLLDAFSEGSPAGKGRPLTSAYVFVPFDALTKNAKGSDLLSKCVEFALLNKGTAEREGAFQTLHGSDYAKCLDKAVKGMDSPSVQTAQIASLMDLMGFKHAGEVLHIHPRHPYDVVIRSDKPGVAGKTLAAFVTGSDVGGSVLQRIEATSSARTICAKCDLHHRRAPPAPGVGLETPLYLHPDDPSVALPAMLHCPDCWGAAVGAGSQGGALRLCGSDMKSSGDWEWDWDGKPKASSARWYLFCRWGDFTIEGKEEKRLAKFIRTCCDQFTIKKRTYYYTGDNKSAGQAVAGDGELTKIPDLNQHSSEHRMSEAFKKFVSRNTESGDTDLHVMLLPNRVINWWVNKVLQQSTDNENTVHLEPGTMLAVEVGPRGLPYITYGVIEMSLAGVASHSNVPGHQEDLEPLKLDPEFE